MIPIIAVQKRCLSKPIEQILLPSNGSSNFERASGPRCVRKRMKILEKLDVAVLQCRNCAPCKGLSTSPYVPDLRAGSIRSRFQCCVSSSSKEPRHPNDLVRQVEIKRAYRLRFCPAPAQRRMGRLATGCSGAMPKGVKVTTVTVSKDVAGRCHVNTLQRRGQRTPSRCW